MPCDNPKEGLAILSLSIDVNLSLHSGLVADEYEGLDAASNNSAWKLFVINEHNLKGPQLVELKARHRLYAEPSSYDWSFIFKVQCCMIIKTELRVIRRVIEDWMTHWHAQR